MSDKGPANGPRLGVLVCFVAFLLVPVCVAGYYALKLPGWDDSWPKSAPDTTGCKAGYVMVDDSQGRDVCVPGYRP